MIKSMTGYGRAQIADSGYDITVEIKSVNHRYYEVVTRIPRAYGYLDDKIKNFIHEDVLRGKLDVYVGITPIDTTDTVVNVNKALASSYYDELKSLAEHLGLEDDMKISNLARFNDIFTLRRCSEDEDIIWDLVKTVTKQAMEPFLDMRKAEGDKMKEDIVSRLETILKQTEEIERLAPIALKQWRQRLQEKLTDVLENTQVDEARILTEAAIYAEKTAVDEETVRLRSHIHQFYTILEEDDAVGRKLDFLVQEMNREVNTIGSKFQDVDASRVVVEMKSEIEKIREQIQNIE